MTLAADKTRSAALSPEAVGWLALLGAVFSISWSSLFVRFADVGPVASAFWRMALALPPIYVWARLEARPGPAKSLTPKGDWAFSILAGLAFAADLAFYHLAIGATSITNATFIANLASILAVAGGALLLKERVGRKVWVALAVALVGAWVMGGAAAGTAGLASGDLFALGAAVAYGVYVLVLKQAQRGLSSAEVMWRSSLVTAAVLLVLALVEGETLLPQTALGWLPLLGLGLLAHATGQGLNAVAIGRLPVAPVALAVLAQPVMTALLARLIIGEPLGLLQAAGAAMILVAVASVRL